MIDDLKLALMDAGRRLGESSLNAGTAGNLSARFADGRVVITRRRTRKSSLTIDDFVVVDPDYREIPAAVSTEYRLHLAAYRADSGVTAVIHAHSPALTALGLRRSSFPPILPELEAVVGSIVINPYEPSGSQRLADDVGRAVARGAGIVILKRHGIVAVGASVAHALDRVELGENAARTILLAER